MIWFAFLLLLLCAVLTGCGLEHDPDRPIWHGEESTLGTTRSN